MHGFEVNPSTGRELTSELTESEIRITNLYYQLEIKKIFPWMWDWENYSGDNEDMYGRFYPEDWNNIQQISSWISTYEKMHKSK